MQEKMSEDVPKEDVTQAQDGGIIKQIKRAGSDPGETYLLRCLQAYRQYRVTLVVAHLGSVDYDFGHSTACPVLIGQMGIWQNWL